MSVAPHPLSDTPIARGRVRGYDRDDPADTFRRMRDLRLLGAFTAGLVTSVSLITERLASQAGFVADAETIQKSALVTAAVGAVALVGAVRSHMHVKRFDEIASDREFSPSTVPPTSEQFDGARLAEPAAGLRSPIPDMPAPIFLEPGRGYNRPR